MQPSIVSVPFFRQSALRSLLAFVLLPVLLCGVGCTKAGPKNSVSGKVTLDGKAVSGSIKFIGPGNKSVMGPINPDGTYIISDPVLGDNKIVVEGGPGGAVAGGMPSAEPSGAGAEKANAAKSTITMGVPPPRKYASPDNGLTFKVTGGKQTYDIPLTP